MSSYQVVRSKMDKTRVLLTDAKLARYVPKTELFNTVNLRAMLKEFHYVYVKPDRGRGGERVVSIALEHSGGYEISYEATVTKVDKIASVVKFLKNIASEDQFIIQQGIRLLCIDGAPFDLRVNVQKPYNKWEVTAFIAKVMTQGKVVTNFAQGGTLAGFEQTLSGAGLSSTKISEVKKLLTYLGERTAYVLNEKYSGLRELGLDIALDSKIEPWILEVNTKPVFPRGLNSKFDRYRRIIKGTKK